MRYRLWAAVVLVVGLSGLAGCIYLANIDPVAVFTAGPLTTGPSPLTVNFDASGSYDPDGAIAAYLWDFDDGQSASSSLPFSHVFVVQTPPQTFRVTLTVFDNLGATDTATEDITVVP